MQREKKYTIKVGSYKFGDNYELIFKDDKDELLNDCNITCGGNCNVTCGNNCKINCRWYCNITCGDNCKIDCIDDCYVKGGEGSQLNVFGNLLKTISKDEEFIWWFIDKNKKLINTFEYVNWKKNNPDKWKELYPFVHNELDSATLF